MTCPNCGAYSPKNTATCNRCGRKLPLLEAQRQNAAQDSQRTSKLPEFSGYGYGYRQPEQTKFGLFLEKVGTFLDDNLLENPDSKKLLLAAAGVLAVIIVLISSCSRCPACQKEPPVVSPSDIISSTDVSGSDVSSTDLSASDVAGETAD